MVHRKLYVRSLYTGGWLFVQIFRVYISSLHSSSMGAYQRWDTSDGLAGFPGSGVETAQLYSIDLLSCLCML